LQKSKAFREEETVQRSNGKDFGVPVVEDYTGCEGDFRGRKAFHSCSERGLRKGAAIRVALEM